MGEVREERVERHKDMREIKKTFDFKFKVKDHFHDLNVLQGVQVKFIENLLYQNVILMLPSCHGRMDNFHIFLEDVSLLLNYFV